jgi:hypothetical protein
MLKGDRHGTVEQGKQEKDSLTFVSDSHQPARLDDH